MMAPIGRSLTGEQRALVTRAVAIGLRADLAAQWIFDRTGIYVSTALVQRRMTELRADVRRWQRIGAPG